MAVQPRPSAGNSFRQELERNPQARAAWQRARTRLQAVAQMLASTGEALSEQREHALRELTEAIREGLRTTDQDLEASGFQAPRTLEEWEHLARIVELPFETIRSGDFTLADVRAIALAWVDRQRVKTKLDGTADATQAPSSLEAMGVSQVEVEVEEDQPPALTVSDRAVLCGLDTFDARELVSVQGIEAAMEPSCRLSERTIARSLTRLISLGLVERPEGDRLGARLTPSGRRLCQKIAD